MLARRAALESQGEEERFRGVEVVEDDTHVIETQHVPYVSSHRFRNGKLMYESGLAVLHDFDEHQSR